MPETPNFKNIFGSDVPILAGAIHYFRVHPDYWYDRLAKLVAAGFNTVEFYIPWNFHEPKEGQFNFDGFADIPRFIEIATKLGLKIIARPGPYICAEWEFGGLPAWLNQYPDMRIRCAQPLYLEKVRNWFSVLIPKLTPYLQSKGGPIFAMQVENEYGYFGSDKKYLAYLRDLMRELGVDCLLFTSDGVEIQHIHGGTLPDLWATSNFGNRPEEAFPVMRKFQPEGPDMCCEFWCGWFDQWGVRHHTRDAADVADVFERMIKMGASVNVYMFHGGTNFAFWNGGNARKPDAYEPTVTSYDYCALLSEAGDMTPAYYACKDVLEKHFGPAPKLEVVNTKKIAYGNIKMTETFPLWDNLGDCIESAAPLTMEELKQEYGYVLYRNTVQMPRVDRQYLIEKEYTLPLTISGLRDRAVIFVNGKKIGTLYRNDPDQAVELPMPEGDSFQLDILVENMGRVNFGNDMAYKCGITGNVQLRGQNLYGWSMYSLPFDKPPAPVLKSGKIDSAPAFYRGTFQANELADTFLNIKNFGKGMAFINGFNLGRYWEIGPAHTMFIPAPLLKQGENEIILFETDGIKHPEVELTDAHVWVEISN